MFENCLKAYIHQGKAHLGLKQFDQAIESYQRAMQIEPTKKKMIESKFKTKHILISVSNIFPELVPNIKVTQDIHL